MCYGKIIKMCSGCAPHVIINYYSLNKYDLNLIVVRIILKSIKMGKHLQILKIFCKLMIFTTFLQLTGCYSSKFISKTDLPVSGGNYVFHGKKSIYPLVKNAIISNGIISGKVDFVVGNYSGDEKFQVYVSNDSLIKINIDNISVPLDGITKIIITGNDHYSFNKTKYDYRTYSFKKGDPYNPSSAGFASLIIPGLGQMISGETGRGLLFLTGFTGCLVATMAGIINLGNSYEGESTVGAQVAFAGLVGAACIDLWSVGDAVRVAKVNNLALRVKHKTSYNLNIKPFLNTPDYGRKHNIPIGLALKVTF
jgi:TM2 domain-containing membrane protein YozV